MERQPKSLKSNSSPPISAGDLAEFHGDKQFVTAIEMLKKLIGKGKGARPLPSGEGCFLSWGMQIGDGNGNA
jgi:hypothetical protein